MRIETCHGVHTSSDKDCMYLINMQDFPDLYSEFCKYVITKDKISTAEVEEEGRRLLPLLKNGLDDAKHANKEIIDDINNFVRSIFKWGGITGQRVGGNVYLKDQSEEENTKIEAAIAEVVAESARILQRKNLDLAFEEIQTFKGFGTSYGSKILRMLLPQHAGAYDDKILKNNFPSYIESGYAEFCADCQKVVDDLKKLGIKSPHDEIDASNPRKNGEWYVADVEAVIYHYCRYYKKT